MSAASNDPWAWVAKAEEDMAVARRVLPDLVGPASFHVQQAIEKLLKAVIVHKGERPPYIHALFLSETGSAHRWNGRRERIGWIASRLGRPILDTRAEVMSGVRLA